MLDGTAVRAQLDEVNGDAQPTGAGVRALSRAFLVAALSLMSAGCPDQTVIRYCVDIPASGGCPGNDLTACGGPTCTSVYSCDHSNGAWTYVGSCPSNDGGVEAAAAADARDADANRLADAQLARRDVSIDAPPGAAGGPGCLGLESPDCTLAGAIDCMTSCCRCQDLYVCADGGWSAWGACVDGGRLVPAAIAH